MLLGTIGIQGNNSGYYLRTDTVFTFAYHLLLSTVDFLCFVHADISKKGGMNVGVIVGVVAGVALVIIVVMAFILVCSRQRREAQRERRDLVGNIPLGHRHLVPFWNWHGGLHCHE